MADVFAVAVMIAYLAAQASQSVPNRPSSAIVAFNASFGSGFFWFRLLLVCRVLPHIPRRTTDICPIPSPD
jgi:hypothetical protein